MNIVIPEDYQDAIRRLQCLELLSAHDVTIYNSHMDTDVLAEHIKDAEVIVLIRERTENSEALLSKLPKLKLISQTGKISTHIDIDACNRHRIPVAEGIGSPVAPAELTWGLILNGMRLLPQAIEGMKLGYWQTNIGNCLYGKSIGIWGYGKIGRMIAGYAKAFGMQVIIWGSERSREAANSDGYIAAESKEYFFSTVDVLSLHLRLSNTTRAIVTSSDLSMMKPTSLLVNTSRAELIAPDALIEGLTAGRPGRAALDVFDMEPLLVQAILCFI